MALGSGGFRLDSMRMSSKKPDWQVDRGRIIHLRAHFGSLFPHDPTLNLAKKDRLGKLVEWFLPTRSFRAIDQGNFEWELTH